MKNILNIVRCYHIFFLLIIVNTVQLHAKSYKTRARRARDAIIKTFYKSELLESFDDKKWKLFKDISSRNAQVKFGWFHNAAAPTPDANNYIGIFVRGQDNSNISINFNPNIIIKSYCSYLSAWVFSINLPGKLGFIIEDSYGTNHQVFFNTLHFRGWRKLKLKLPDNIVQKRISLASYEGIKIKKIIFIPRETGSLNWQLLFIDQIEAQTRALPLLPELEIK